MRLWLSCFLSFAGGGAVIVAEGLGATPQRWLIITLAAVAAAWGGIINPLAVSNYRHARRTAQRWEALYRAEREVAARRDNARWS